MSGDRHRQSGLTLIEILVAMSVLAILSVLGYKAFSSLLIARERLTETSREWVDLARVFRRVEHDVARLPTRKEMALWRDYQLPSGVPLRFDGAGLVLTVFSARAAGARESLSYASGPDGLTWSSSLDAGARWPLLGPGIRVSWRMLADDGRWMTAWPPEDGAGGGKPQTGVPVLPRAIGMTVTLPGNAPVERIWRLPS